MKRIVTLVIWVLSLVSWAGMAIAAQSVAEGAAGQNVVNAQGVRDLVELANKYEATGKLPQSVVVEGKSCNAEAAAACLLTVIGKVLDKTQREGKEAVPQEDLDKISALREALREELGKAEGYLTLRESLDKILARPEEPAFWFMGTAQLPAV